MKRYVFALAFLSATALAQVELEGGQVDPPADPVLQLRTPPFNLGNDEGFVRQVNVDSSGNNIAGDAANEPSIWINPVNPLQITIGWRQFDNVTSNFRQAGNAYSTDGGHTWHKQPNLEAGIFRSDPVLGGTLEGNHYYLSLTQDFFDSLWRSSNGGATYTNIGPATGGDKQWFTTDLSNSTGHGFLYQIWSTSGNNYNGRQFSRSTNAGATWMNPINIPQSPVWGTVDVGTNGTLYGCGTNFGSTFRFFRSQNAKNAGVTPTFDLSVNPNIGGSILYSQGVNPGGLLGQAWIAVDKSSGPSNGFLYMLCSVGGTAQDPCDVNFIRSTDGGQNWSAPIHVNDDARGQGAYHWFGTLSVAPDGRLDVTWNDTRGTSSADPRSRLYHSHSYDNGITWSVNVPIGPTFNQFLGYPNQNKMGDYIGSISDATGVGIAFTATYNSEEDVYFQRYEPPFAVAQITALNVVSGSAFSGGIASVLSSDNQRFCMFPDEVTLLGSVEFIATSTYPSPTKMIVSIEASVTRPGLSQAIALLNKATSNFDVLRSDAASTTDATYSSTQTTGVRNYVDGSVIRGRIFWDTVNDEDPSQDGWLNCIDLVQITVYE